MPLKYSGFSLAMWIEIYRTDKKAAQARVQQRQVKK